MVSSEELTTYDEALVPRVYHSFDTNELASSNFIEYMFATKRPDRELAKLVSSWSSHGWFAKH